MKSYQKTCFNMKSYQKHCIQNEIISKTLFSSWNHNIIEGCLGLFPCCLVYSVPHSVKNKVRQWWWSSQSWYKSIFVDVPFIVISIIQISKDFFQYQTPFSSFLGWGKCIILITRVVNPYHHYNCFLYITEILIADFSPPGRRLLL